MNEMNFRIGVSRAQTVITMKSHKRLLLTDANNRDYITLHQLSILALTEMNMLYSLF